MNEPERGAHVQLALSSQPWQRTCGQAGLSSDCAHRRIAVRGCECALRVKLYAQPFELDALYRSTPVERPKLTLSSHSPPVEALLVRDRAWMWRALKRPERRWSLFAVTQQ
eukprot:5009436-Pleurochrysis_carterae.AAC.4